MQTKPIDLKILLQTNEWLLKMKDEKWHNHYLKFCALAYRLQLMSVLLLLQKLVLCKFSGKLLMPMECNNQWMMVSL
ncbi:hypothetical protein B4U78_015630 [Microbacterium esteraromaticum]|nr:hypothetical protein B4U78_015630 [Microbacterium esteraromaticum]